MTSSPKRWASRAGALRIGVVLIGYAFATGGAAAGQMFDEMRATVKASSGGVVDLTPIAARYVRVGLPEADAKEILSDNGFVGGNQYASDEFDSKSTRSDYYVAFRRSTPLFEFPWSSYVVALGFSDGSVDFVSSESKPEVWP